MLDTAMRIIVYVLLAVVSALPLYLAVNILGKRTSLLKVFLVNILVAVVFASVQSWFLTWGWILGIIVLLLVYKVMFDIGWIRALLVWVVQMLFIVLFSLALMLLGIFL
ncbi:MAG: hypothetical protein KJ709_02485 [Nanoarchaeota archaeon]|nr:hypothetical protein [Nanoarchaeota archaeon]